MCVNYPPALYIKIHTKLNYIMLDQVMINLACAGFELTTSVLIGTDCIGSCKSN